MPDVEIAIGERKFFVTCREGEEHFLISAARMLDAEAQPIQAQLGRLPEARMLLMAGLMLADRTASLEDELRQAQARIAELESETVPGPAPMALAVAAGEDWETLAEQAEALAARIEELVA
ncbi:cell division protein ZapA [Rhodobacter sp. KR11]|jgi:cell division protein ZapA|uniref:cell division protein ZapA n=1 Tax=Rhodobacter sp. KR11 TaxID=2974588 RepID=UPI0022224B24|nr:cell division protein ZapA [Rhodobacter sp. KR11]MCW1917652.1 cell division protein ZapA [Rhodobacter sp. KR11]